MTEQTSIRIGPWTASPALNLLERGERSVKIEPRAMDVLVHLAGRAGEVVSVDELLASVWRGVVVSDGSVYLAIKQLRQALKSPGDATVYIETIPKRGYRLVAPVEPVTAGAQRTARAASSGPSIDGARADATLRPTDRGRAARRPWTVVAALAIALVGAALATIASRLSLAPAPDAHAMRFDLLSTGSLPGALAISPDGHFIAYAAESGGRRQIFLRPIDALAARALPGTDDARFISWSPDSRSLAFLIGDGTLKRMDVDGEPAATIAEVTMLAWGAGAWTRDGKILHTIQGTGFPIGELPAEGGAPQTLTTPDIANGETGHFVPRMLPDGDHFLYVGGGQNLPIATLYVGSRKARTSTALMPIEDPVKANRFANLAFAEGQILYLRGATLMAQPFDAEALVLRGEALPVAANVDDFSVSDTGVLVYSERTSASGAVPVPLPRLMAWFDRRGARIGTIGAAAAYIGPALSPDARRVAVAIASATPGESDLWIVDERGSRTRLTFDEARDSTAVWSPDGARVAFGSGRNSAIPFVSSAIYERAADGVAPENRLFTGAPGEIVVPTDWSDDGRFILLARAASVDAERMDIWAMPTATRDANPFPLLESPFRKHAARLSPDGRWLAYTTNESGRDEVVVQPFPEIARGKWPVSTHGGAEPRWRGDGREMFYVAPNGAIMAVEVHLAGDELELGAPYVLFEARLSTAETTPVEHYDSYDVSPDGERFLLNERIVGDIPEAGTDGTAPLAIRVIVNWTLTLGAPEATQ